MLVHNDCLAGYGKRKSTPSSDDVNIDMDHVIERHTSNGKIAKQSGIKDAFPDSMDSNSIKKSIKDAYNSGKQVGSIQYSNGQQRIRLQGQTENDLILELWYNKTTKTIETTYPIYGGIFD